MPLCCRAEGHDIGSASSVSREKVRRLSTCWRRAAEHECVIPKPVHHTRADLQPSSRRLSGTLNHVDDVILSAGASL